MKPKTFTYNQMIQFFLENKLPLNPAQVHLVGTMVQTEMKKIEAWKARRKAKADKKFIERHSKRNKVTAEPT